MKNLLVCSLMQAVLCEEFNSEKYCGGIDEFQKPSANAVKAAQQEMQKENEEIKIKEAKRQLIIDEYSQTRNAIEARYKKKTGELETKYLKLQTEENAKYAAGEVATEDHRKELEKFRDEKEKEADALIRQRQRDIETLDRKLPDGRRYCSNIGLYY